MRTPLRVLAVLTGFEPSPYHTKRGTRYPQYFRYLLSKACASQTLRAYGAKQGEA